MKKYLSNVIQSAFAIAIMSIGAFAAQQPDLAVQAWVGPTSATVNTTYQYRASVRNIGTQTAQGVTLTIEFPLTNTSPTRHILGKLTGFPSNCSKVSNKLVCNFGSVSKHPSSNLRTVTFNFEYPVTTKPLELIAKATTTSLNESNTGNNQLAFNPTVSYPNLPVTSADVLVSLCTGQNLTSFMECELYPSSISSFPMRLEAGGLITVSEPGYFGNWDQPALNQMHFNITDGSSGAEFNGFAANGNCFEGTTSFTPASQYMSVYRVCIQ